MILKMTDWKRKEKLDEDLIKEGYLNERYDKFSDDLVRDLTPEGQEYLKKLILTEPELFLKACIELCEEQGINRIMSPIIAKKIKEKMDYGERI